MIQSFKLAVKAILSNKMRSFLTMLGIIIGVAAVIILVSVVSGYMGEAIAQFEKMGVNRITIFCRNRSSRHITEDDIYGFWDEHPEWISGISPLVSLSNVAVKSGNENITSTVVTGVSEDYMDIIKYNIEEGRNLVYSDIANRSSTCVVGAYIANEFYGSADKAVNDSIKISGTPYTIVGVVETQDEDNMTEDGTDNFIWIPYSVAIKKARNGFINNFNINSSDTKYTKDLTDALKQLLYSKFKNENFYNVQAMSSVIDDLNAEVAMLTALLGGVAGISLLVAGIGVMNIMLVSVTERTREIGIRKALGARPGVIMQQFVIEAIVTSCIGGIIGIIIGASGTKGIGALMGITCKPTLWAILLSFSVSVLIGVIFGYLPAKNAAKLNPIEALRID